VRPFLPHHDWTQTQHGFASLFELPGNGLGLVWLDGRQQVKDREHSILKALGTLMSRGETSC